ncbi:hypothetical protein ES706_02391 [subsurface metagenome]
MGPDENFDEEKKIQELIRKIPQDLGDLTEAVVRLRIEYVKRLRELSRTYGVDFTEEALESFLKRPYAILPKSGERNEFYVAVPKFVDFQVGYLDHSTDSFNVFVITKYTQWLGQAIPDDLREELDFKKPEPITVTDGVISFPEEYEPVVAQRYGGYLTSISKGKARIRPGNEFDLIAEIIDNGSLPFVPKQVSEVDLREPQVKFELKGKYSYQRDAFDTFLKYGATGIFWMPGSGKTFIGMFILDSLKGSKLVVCPGKTMIEQWKSDIAEWSPRLKEELETGDLEIVTYHAYPKIRGKDYVCVIFDECHRLPADTFSRMATIKAKYRAGLSATPFREDGRSVAYDEPVLCRIKGKVRIGKIGPLVESYLSKGETIKDVSGLEVLSLDFGSGKLMWKEVSQVSQHRHNDNIRKISLTSGREIKVTDKHSVMAVGDNFNIIPKRAGELKKDDVLLAPRKEMTEKTSQISPLIARLLGRYVADGCMNSRRGEGYQVVFSAGSREEGEGIAEDLGKLGLNPHIHRDREAFRVTCSNKKAYSLFSGHIPPDMKAHTKRVPDIILNSPPAIMREYWDGYWDGDAGVTVNRELASDHLYLLGMVGTDCYVSKSRNEGTFKFPDGHEITQSCLRYVVTESQGKSPFRYLPWEFVERSFLPVLTQRRKGGAMKKARSFSLETFPRRIGIEADNRLRLLVVAKEKGEVTTSIVSEVLKKKRGTAQAYLKKMGFKGLIERHRIGHKHLGEAVWKLTELGEVLVRRYRGMKQLFEGDFSFVRVKGNIGVNYEHEYVYDLNVPNSQTFVAGCGGILCHNTNYIFSLTGYPIGLDWKALVKLLGKTFHEVDVYILKNEREKLARVMELVDPERKTQIFCDGIELGKKISQKLRVPFVYGETKNRLETLRKEPVVVISRVGDLGVSIKDLEHLVEADFLMGSRTQELSRSTRLFHSMAKIKHHDILFTEDEFYLYRKRLHGLVERGFKINVQRFVRRPIVEAPARRPHVPRRTVERVPKIREPTEEERKVAAPFIQRKLKEIERVVNELTPNQRRILKFMTIAKRSPKSKIARALGIEDVNADVDGLVKLELLRKHPKHGFFYNLGRKVTSDLLAFKASAVDIKDAVKQIEKLIKEWE